MYIDLAYDGLPLTVILDDDDGDPLEICATSDGTEVTHLFTDCVRYLIYSKARVMSGINSKFG